MLAFLRFLGIGVKCPEPYEQSLSNLHTIPDNPYIISFRGPDSNETPFLQPPVAWRGRGHRHCLGKLDVSSHRFGVYSFTGFRVLISKMCGVYRVWGL